jgi:hypothetical protein
LAEQVADNGDVGEGQEGDEEGSAYGLRDRAGGAEPRDGAHGEDVKKVGDQDAEGDVFEMGSAGAGSGGFHWEANVPRGRRFSNSKSGGLTAGLLHARDPILDGGMV